MKSRSAIAATLAVTLLGVAAPAVAKHHHPHPDLIVTKVTAPTGAATAGTRVTLGDVTRNRGGAAARHSVTAYYLARATTRHPGDIRLGQRSVPRLQPRTASSASGAFRLPSGANGSYVVIACSNDTHTVTESSRRNDCRGSSPFTVHPDASPPAFAGVKTATGGCGYYGCQNPAHLTWDPATDNVTPQGKIVYDIYRARFDQPGTQDFSAPTYTSSPGATSFTAPVEDTPVGCWVVRARDQLGNRDSNKQEICNSPPP